jgi:hypothetical protein
MELNLIRVFRRLLSCIKVRTPCEKKRRLNVLLASSERFEKINFIVNKLFGGHPLTILHGPFAGMKYINSASGSQLLPKLVGSYEEPLHDWMYAILNESNYTSIIDVGCAEGYYAVGLCGSKSSPRVYGFDIDDDALKDAQRLADLNDRSESVYFDKLFSDVSLEKILEADSDGRYLIFMDVEGAEVELLNPETHPNVLKCDILVELHDCFDSTITNLIVDYLSNTHEININVDYPWRNSDYSLVEKKLTKEDYLFALDEVRPRGMRWIYAKKNERR